MPHHSTMTRHVLVILGTLLAICGRLEAVEQPADLQVVNGDFSDTSGLLPHGGHGWLQGVPAGWRATAAAPVYAVHTGADATEAMCNVSQFGVLEQQVGTLSAAADVGLTLTVADAWHKGADLAAEIRDVDGEVYGHIALGPGRDRRLIVANVPAGTAVVIRFQALRGTTPALDDVRVTTHPPGSATPTPQLRVRRFQPDEPLARAGRAAALSLDIDHLNAEDVDIEVALSTPSGVRIVQPSANRLHRVRAAEGRSRLTWSLEADAATAAEIGLDIRALDGSPVAREMLRMLFLPPLARTSPPSMPEPVPARSDRLIGAHHCPLWEPDQPDMWLNVLKHPERTPALGLYAQNDPEVADWETRWAVEHGISFFVYCWYRDGQGGAVKTRFGSAIHDGLFRSRFADRMTFSLMWENQARGRAGVADEEDLLTNLLPYWIDTYFRHDSYLKVDGRPVLFIYRPEYLVDDLGGAANVAAAFTRMRQACRQAGFAGLLILGEYRGTDPEHLTLLKTLGLDSSFAYCWPVGGSPSPPQAVQAQMDAIRRTQELGILPQVVTVSQGWSGWQDEGSIWSIPPREFEGLLRQAKAFTAGLPPDQLGSRMLLLDNWNEWGEGHFIAPHREHGFEYLDAVRRVFTDAADEHVDLLPDDVGRGPYDAVARTYFAALEEKSRLASTRVRSPDVPRGLVAWWTFDEPDDSPVALDFSGHRNGGSVEKAARVPGHAGNALRCDGGCVFVPHSPTLATLERFTVACRVRTDVVDQDNRWLVNGVFGHNVCGGFRLGFLRGRPCFQVPSTAWSHHLVGDEPMPTGRWVHLAATFDGAIMRLFMDGRECGSMQRQGPRVPTDGRLVLGNYDVAHPASFAGLLDDVRIYRRVLTPDELRADVAAVP
jgi:hypothetical protein